LLIQLSHGDLLFQRFAGIVLFHSANIAAAVLLAGMGIILMTASNRQSVRTCPEALLLMFGVTLFLATVVICPRTADRYFHLLLYLVPIIMAFAFQTLFERIGSRLSVIAFCLFLGIQLARTGINYFASLHTYGGLTSVFALDNTLETSNHLIRTDILYKELTGLHITTIMAEYFIALPLRFYDLRNHTFRSVIVTDHDVTHLLDEGALLPQEEPCIVMYADGLRRLTSEEVPNLKEISSDQHFIVGFYKPLDRHP